MTAQGRQVSILGVPTSAGSHNPGQEKAPAAWRAAGLIGELRAAGLDVEDRGDLPAAPYRPVEPVDGLRDVDRVAEVARGVAGSGGVNPASAQAALSAAGAGASPHCHDLRSGSISPELTRGTALACAASTAGMSGAAAARPRGRHGPDPIPRSSG